MNTHISPEKIFIGVSWPYANGNIHIGHLAGQYIVCDVFARYHRLKGNDVLMVSGSDSHGAPVVFKAEELGITPSEMAQQSHEEIVNTYTRLGLVYENYTKTTTDTHKEVAQNIFLVLKEGGYLQVKKSKQYYDPKVERFLPDRYVRGTCPVCRADNARGDECPECGEYLEPEQLLDPKSTLSDATPILRETEHFYMDLSALQEPLKKWLFPTSKHWRKWVREFSKGWINQGLEPRPVTRDMKFGIPVPVDGWDDKVLYVWIEAVIGYLSAAIEWAEKTGDPSKWEDYWKANDCKHYYFIAGGNVPFHTILWPAEIIAYNEKFSNPELFEKYKLPGEVSLNHLQLPYDVPGNNMLFYKGKKMSKGDGGSLSVDNLLDMFGADALRYFFVKYAPEKQDRDFIWKDFIDANNCELVANIGNFIYRTLSFTYTRFDGNVPDGTLEKDVETQIQKAFSDVSSYIKKAEFVKSIESVLELGHFANKYFNDHEPWQTIKTNKEDTSQTLFNCIQVVNALRVLLKPFTPFASERLSTTLGITDEYDPTADVVQNLKVTKFIDQWKFSILSAGCVMNEPQILFEKFEYTEQLKLADNPVATETPATKSVVFEKDEALDKIPTVWKLYSNVNSKKMKPALREKLSAEFESYTSKLTPNWYNTPLFKGYKDLHDKYSVEKDLPGSVELLLHKSLKEGSIPKINGFVDVYNLVSILSGVSIGAHDIKRLKGNPTLKILSDDLHFMEIGSGDENVAYKGEYAYTDEKGIICKLDIKQSMRTRVSEKSKNILVILQGHGDLDEQQLKDTLTLLDTKLKEYGIIR